MGVIRGSSSSERACLVRFWGPGESLAVIPHVTSIAKYPGCEVGVAAPPALGCGFCGCVVWCVGSAGLSWSANIHGSMPSSGCSSGLCRTV